jgi:hypothetical protein
LILSAILILVGCSNSSATSPTTTLQPTSTLVDTINFPPGKYDNTQVFSDLFNLSWSVDETYIYIGIKARTPGWIGLSLTQEPHGGNSDVFVGYISPSGSIVLNEYNSVDYDGDHVLDTSQDVILVSGNEGDYLTTIEFKRKLNTGDPSDIILDKGTYYCIWAYGLHDDLTKAHALEDSTTIIIQ